MPLLLITATRTMSEVWSGLGAVVLIGDSEADIEGDADGVGLSLVKGEAEANGFVVAALVAVAVVLGVFEVIGVFELQDTAMIARLMLSVT